MQLATALLRNLYELVPPAGSHGTRDAQASLSTVNPLEEGAQEIETMSSILQRIEVALKKAQELDDKRRSGMTFSLHMIESDSNWPRRL